MEIGLLAYSLLGSVYCVLVSAYTWATWDADTHLKGKVHVEMEGWVHASVSLVLLYQQRFLYFALTLPVTFCTLAGVTPKSAEQWIGLKVGYYCLLTCLLLYL